MAGAVELKLELHPTSRPFLPRKQAPRLPLEHSIEILRPPLELKIENKEIKKPKKTANEKALEKTGGRQVAHFYNQHPQAYAYAQKASGVSPSRFAQRTSLGLSFLYNYQASRQNIFNLHRDPVVRNNFLYQVKAEDKKEFQKKAENILLAYEAGKLIPEGLLRLNSPSASLAANSDAKPAITAHNKYLQPILELIREICQLQLKMIERIEEEAEGQRQLDLLAEKKREEKREAAKVLAKAIREKRAEISSLIKKALSEVNNDKRNQLALLITELKSKAAKLEASQEALIAA